VSVGLNTQVQVSEVEDFQFAPILSDISHWYLSDGVY